MLFALHPMTNCMNKKICITYSLYLFDVMEHEFEVRATSVGHGPGNFKFNFTKKMWTILMYFCDFQDSEFESGVLLNPSDQDQGHFNIIFTKNLLNL